MDIRKNKNTKYIVLFIIIGLIGAAILPIPIVLAERDEVAAFELSVEAKEAEIKEAEEYLDSLPKTGVTLGEGGARALDLSKPCGFTAEELAPYLQGGTVGLEEEFIEAEKLYGVNAVFLVSIAALESAWGTLNFRTNNMFGYGQASYATKADNIYAVAEGLGGYYLTPGGSLYYGTSIDAVHTKYATSSTWDDKVAKQMESLYGSLSAEQQVGIDADIAAAEEKVRVLEEELETLHEVEAEREKPWFMKD